MGSSSRSLIKIAVIGVGGAGCSVVAELEQSGLTHAKLIAIDTDIHMLSCCSSTETIFIGEYTYPRPFCSLPPEWCRQAVLDDSRLIRSAIIGTDVVFLVVGLGGGTGTGAAPAIIEICQGLKAFTIAFVSQPFRFEGKNREKIARQGQLSLEAVADMTVEVPYNCIRGHIPGQASFRQLYYYISGIFKQGIEHLVAMIYSGETMLLDGDFEVLRPHVMTGNHALMGIGSGDSVLKAMKAAMADPLLGTASVEKAEKIIMSINVMATTTMAEIGNSLDLLKDNIQRQTIVVWAVTGVADEAAVVLFVTGSGVFNNV